MITVSSGCLSAPLLPHRRGSGVQSASIRVSLRFQRGKVSHLYDSQSKNKDANVSDGFPSIRRHICHVKPKGWVEEVRWGVREWKPVSASRLSLSKPFYTSWICQSLELVWVEFLEVSSTGSWLLLLLKLERQRRALWALWGPEEWSLWKHPGFFQERGEQWVSFAGQSAQERKTRTRSNPCKSHLRSQCPHALSPRQSTSTPCFHLRILPILHKLRCKLWLMLQDSGDNFEKSGQGCQYMWPDLTAVSMGKTYWWFN